MDGDSRPTSSSSSRMSARDKQRQRLAAKKKMTPRTIMVAEKGSRISRRTSGDWTTNSTATATTSLTSSLANMGVSLDDDDDIQTPPRTPLDGIDDIDIGSVAIAPSSFAAKMKQQGVDEFSPHDLRFEGDASTEEKAEETPLQAANLGEFLEDPDWIYKPVPPDIKVLFQIVRSKGGPSHSPDYVLKVENHHGRQRELLTVLFAKKRKKAKSAYYMISRDIDKFSRDQYDAKLRSNMVGTHFSVYGPGVSPAKAVESGGTLPLREELVAVNYESNVLGFKGPRKMTAYLPSLNEKHERIKVIPHVEEDGLIRRAKNKQLGNVMVLENKKPVWNDQSKSYVLNFHGRVTLPSVKNFQLVHEDHQDYVILQFGRTGQDSFTMDIQHPMSAVQAFGICLSSFDGKIAVE